MGAHISRDHLRNAEATRVAPEFIDGRDQEALTTRDQIRRLLPLDIEMRLRIVFRRLLLVLDEVLKTATRNLIRPFLIVLIIRNFYFNHRIVVEDIRGFIRIACRISAPFRGFCGGLHARKTSEFIDIGLRR